MVASKGTLARDLGRDVGYFLYNLKISIYVLHLPASGGCGVIGQCLRRYLISSAFGAKCSTPSTMITFSLFKYTSFTSSRIVIIHLLKFKLQIYFWRVDFSGDLFVLEVDRIL